MSTALVSIGLPVRNGEKVIGDALASIAEQNYENIEIVVSDNASDDGTEEICRERAKADPRIRYHRQPVNIGLDKNFDFVLHQARAAYFKWVGDDDQLASDYISRCLDVLVDDPRLVLVTTQQSFQHPDGTVRTETYDGVGLRSATRVERLAEMLRLLNSSHLLIDPLYGLMKRSMVVKLPRKTMLRSDQIYAVRLSLAGPWGHLNEVLAHRGWPDESRRQLVRRMGVPRWNARVATALQAREMLSLLAESDMNGDELWAARREVAAWYVGWHRRRVLNGGSRVAREASVRWRARGVVPGSR